MSPIEEGEDMLPSLYLHINWNKTQDKRLLNALIIQEITQAPQSLGRGSPTPQQN